jgi:drug/metabolite transporter (DMT)-like permease
MKFSNDSMNAESIFFYMMITSLMLSPLALMMTDFSQPIHTGFKGPYLAFGIHLLNSIGALALVYALRYGKAIVVVPMTGLSPIITVILSLILYGVIPSLAIIAGVALAMVAIYLLSE